jgi:hypothetical protein
MLSLIVNLTEIAVDAKIAPELLRATAWYGMPCGAWACTNEPEITSKTSDERCFIFNIFRNLIYVFKK